MMKLDPSASLGVINSADYHGSGSERRFFGDQLSRKARVI
jgi:hypothetical protein